MVPWGVGCGGCAGGVALGWGVRALGGCCCWCAAEWEEEQVERAGEGLRARRACGLCRGWCGGWCGGGGCGPLGAGVWGVGAMEAGGGAAMRRPVGRREGRGGSNKLWVTDDR